MPKNSLRESFSRSEPAGKRTLQKIRSRLSQNNARKVRRQMFETKYVYWVLEDHVFVTLVEGIGVYRLITYWRMEE